MGGSSLFQVPIFVVDLVKLAVAAARHLSDDEAKFARHSRRKCRALLALRGRAFVNIGAGRVSDG